MGFDDDKLPIPQVMYEHGEPLWNINREKLLIYPPQLYGNPSSSHQVAEEEEMVKEMKNFAL
jgi:hypothetical protein